MCLILKSDSKIEKSEKGIKVWKVLDYNGHAPFQNTRYKKGELKTTPYFTGIVSFHGWGFSKIKKITSLEGVPEIYKGLHVFSTLAAARRYHPGSIVVECMIPRRTPFIRGTYSQIATLGLRVGKAMKKRRYTPERYVERFNKVARTKRNK
jgi:hypothetical protein